MDRSGSRELDPDRQRPGRLPLLFLLAAFFRLLQL
jgi:hypothetical protein